MNILFLLLVMSSNSIIVALPMQDKSFCQIERDVLKAAIKEHIDWRVGCYDLAKQNFVE